MPNSSISSFHNDGPEASGQQLVGQRPLPGLPGGRGVDEPDPISDEVLDALLAGAQTAEEIAGPDGVLAHLTRRLLNRALDAELTAHLGYEAGQRAGGRGGELAQWPADQDGLDRSGPGCDPFAPGSPGHV